MARKSSSSENSGAVARVIFMMFIWVLYALFTLACISYSSSDPPSRSIVVFESVDYHNWVGKIGAHMSYAAMTGIGPGIFVAIVLIGMALFLWTKGDEITQLPLRIIGGALLVAVVSTLFNLLGHNADGGGMLGIALGSLLHFYFKHGSWFIMIATMVVGALLVADEIVLGLPAKLLWLGKRLPTDAAADAAGGMWQSFVGMFESMGKKKTEVKPTRKKKDAPAEEGASEAAAEIAKNPKEDVAAARSDAKSDNKIDAKPGVKSQTISAELVKAIATAVADEDEELDVVAPGQVVVRKPAAPKGPSLPFRPAPAPAQKQDLGNYRLPGLDLLDEPEPIDTAGQETRVREKAKVLEAALESFNIDGRSLQSSRARG